MAQINMSDLANGDIRASRSEKKEIVENQKDNVELLRKRKAISNARSNARRSKEQVAYFQQTTLKGTD